jgi:hypothetical protein
MARDEHRDRKAALIGVCFQRQAHWLRALVFDNGTWRAYSSRLLKNLDFDSARRHSEYKPSYTVVPLLRRMRPDVETVLCKLSCLATLNA